jgi:exodeoxyribonuclease VIII
MNNREYHADTSRISKSGLDYFAQSPAHYWARYLDPNRVPDQPTKALLTGSAVHTAILEPHKFQEEFTIMPAFNARTNEGKEQKAIWLAANDGKTVIDIETYDLATRLRDKVHGNKTAAQLLQIGKAEETVFFDDPESGAKCKMRADFLTADGIIVDLKTTMDASAEAFGRSAVKYRYHVQSAFYSHGYELDRGYAPEAFVFIAVETTYPYEVAIYHADDNVIALGRDTFMPELHRYAACVRTGKWPGYGDLIQLLQLPGWAFKRNQ